MVSVFASSVADGKLKAPRSGLAKDCNIGSCLFHAKHAVLRSNSRKSLDRNQDDASEWSDMSIHCLLFQ